MKCILFSFLAFCVQVSACTGLMLKTEEGMTVNGRTVEFATHLDFSVAVIPRGYQFVGKVPQGQGMSYRSKYAATGIYCFDDVVLMDGINEKGLVAAAFYFPGYASYAKMTPENQKKALSPADFPNWLLTQFATLDEVREGIKNVVIAPTVLQNWGPTPPPMHYIVYDESGKSLVIEPLEEKLVVYDNPIGVITNSPTFDWQLTNLINFINLTPYNVDPMKLGTLTLTPFGQGSGLVGLPGDFTPPSRFVRAALFSQASVMMKQMGDLTNQIFHVLNQFDIPFGVIREKEKGSVAYDYTLLTSVKDPKALKYYYKSYADQTVKFIDLNQFNLNDKKIRVMKVAGEEKPIDVSSQMQQ